MLLDFWTYGCINCIHIIPDLRRLEAEYPDELVVIGVHSAKFTNEGDTDNIRQIILPYGLEHPALNDKDFRVWGSWGAYAWPTLVLIDPAGSVVGGHSGEGIYPIFRPVIDSLVREFDRDGRLDRTPLELKLEKEGLPSNVLSFPGKVLADPPNDRLFIVDTNHHRVVVVALGADGSTLYVADTDNHAVRALDLATGQVSTLVGTGLQARQYPPAAGQAPGVELSSPRDLALEEDALSIAMAGTHQIWRMDLASGRVEPFAGSGREGTFDGDLAAAQLAQPSGLALDGRDRLYFADTYNRKIKRIDPDESEIVTFLGEGHGWRDGAEPLFYRQVLEVPAVELRSGQGRVVLDVELPPGCKINTLAPSSFNWEVQGDAITLPPDANLTVHGPTLPVSVPATFQAGQAMLTGEFAIYYCEAETESLCLIEQLRVTVPVTVGSSGQSELRIPYRIQLPDTSELAGPSIA